MLQLYDFDKRKVQGLTEYQDYKIESVLESGDKTLSFSYPSILSGSILEEFYIRNETDEFVIKEIKDDGKWKSVVAVINVEELEGKAWEEFDLSKIEQEEDLTIEDQLTIEDCLNLIVIGTKWKVEMLDNVSKIRTIRKINCSSWDLIQEVKKLYRVEIEFDTLNKIIKVYEKIGSNKGSYFIDKLNLKELELETDSYDYYTRIIAIGKNDIKVEVENKQYSKKVKTLIWKDEKYTDEESLREDAILKLDEISKPRKSYRASVIDLARLSDKYKNILDYKLGDVVTIISKDLKIKDKQRIVKITEYPDDPSKNDCEMSNTTLSFKDLQKEFKDTSSTVSNITEDNGRISEKAIKEVVDKITIDKVNANNIVAAKGTIGTLEVNKLSVDNINIDFAEINKSIANKIEVTDLIAEKIKFDIASGVTLDLQVLLSKFITGENGQYLNLTTKNVVIDDAVIKDAMIDTISAEKINTGTLDTNLVTVQSSSGNLFIKDNTIQIKDSNRTRVQIGKDASDDYNMYVWDDTGKLMFDATGLKADGIKNKIIRDDMLADDANIGGEKINIRSLITKVNEDKTQTIKASKVAFDGTGQSLEVSFNSLKSNLENIEVGGRNYIKNSNFSNGLDNWDYSTGISVVDGKATIISSSLTSNLFLRQLRIPISEQNTEYTLSLEVNATDIIFGNNGRITVPIYARDSNGTTLVETLLASTVITKSGKYIFTFTTPNKVFYFLEPLFGLVNASGTVSFYNIKLEKGNKVTDWTPAPEDADERIQANTALINVAQEGIETLIKDTIIEKDGKEIKLKDAYTSLSQDYNKFEIKVTENYATKNYIVENIQPDIVKAQKSADSANALISDIESDSKLTPNEKQSIKKEWDTIVSEKPKVESNAYEYGIDYKVYTTSYNALNAYISPLLLDLTTTAAILGNTLRINFKNYYDARQDLLNAINLKAKRLADNAQKSVDGIQIGGRNLAIKGSLYPYNTGANTTLDDTSFVKDGGAVITRKAVINDGIMLDRYIAYEKDKNYVISFLMKAMSDGIDSFQIYNGYGHKNNSVYLDGIKLGAMGENLKFPNDKVYHKVEVYFTSVDISANNPDVINSIHILLQVMKSNAIAYSVQVIGFKIEEGTKTTAWSPAPEDIDSSISSVYDYISSTAIEQTSQQQANLEVMSNSVLTTVSQTYALKSDTEELIGSLSSSMDQTSKDIEMKFNEAIDFSKEIDGKMQEFKKNVETNIIFSIDGIVISKEGSPFASNFTNDKLSFTQHNNEVAYISSNKMFITDVEINNKLTIGEDINGYFDFLPRTNGNLSIVWRLK